MGAIRSAYNAPVFWRPGQVIPDTIFWYFADKCAGKFPYRHCFQTGYQYDDWLPSNSIGEQPGDRTYSKGNGPVGAPHIGLAWNGQKEWFVSGVPRSVPILHKECLNSLVGSIPFPPPSTYTDLFIAMEVGGATPSEFGGTQSGPLDYDFLSPTPNPGRCYGGHWFFSDSEGMILEPLVFEDHGFRGPYFAVFTGTNENTLFLSYGYEIRNILDGLVDTVQITVAKCIP